MGKKILNFKCTYLTLSLSTFKLNSRIQGLDPWVEMIHWRRKWKLTPVFLPGKSHGQRSLGVYSPWGHQESDTTKWLKIKKCGSNTLVWVLLRPSSRKTDHEPLKGNSAWEEERGIITWSQHLSLSCVRGITTYSSLQLL